MHQKWFYSSGGRTHGPYTTAEIKILAVAGLLESDTLIWPEGASSSTACAVHAALDLTALSASAIPVPDWLSDFQEDRGPQPIKWRKAGMPSWVADFLNSPDLSPKATRSTKTEVASDTVHVMPSPLGRQDTCGSPSEMLSPEETGASAAPIPAKIDVKYESHAPPPPRRARNTAVRQQGFDPQTGEVFDADRFDEWKKGQQSARQPNEATSDVFHRGRRVVETWVDAEENQSLVVSGNFEAICSNTRLRESLAAFRACGQEIMEKLLNHLIFMVENRKKFYTAQSRQR